MEDWIKFLIIAIIVPLQYLIVEHYNAPDVGSTRSLHDGGRGFVAQALDWGKQIFDETPRTSHLASRNGAANSRYDRETSASSRSERRATPTPRYFSTSKEPRRDRHGVKFRVGQVVEHKRYGYRGVIVGWDAVAQAPDHWYQQMGVSDAQQQDPFYSVLVDTRDRQQQTTYVWQGNLELVRGSDKQIQHPEVTDSFKRYSPSLGSYELKDYLRHRYPKD
eukprot:m.109932 g.109932  ORF g.109932 m.109932 type:complete len:220 (-) comp15357_c0_seq1:1247-1906(-)